MRISLFIRPAFWPALALACALLSPACEHGPYAGEGDNSGTGSGSNGSGSQDANGSKTDAGKLNPCEQAQADYKDGKLADLSDAELLEKLCGLSKRACFADYEAQAQFLAALYLGNVLDGGTVAAYCVGLDAGAK